MIPLERPPKTRASPLSSLTDRIAADFFHDARYWNVAGCPCRQQAARVRGWEIAGKGEGEGEFSERVRRSGVGRGGGGTNGGNAAHKETEGETIQ